jgi:hypothetical protein
MTTIGTLLFGSDQSQGLSRVLDEARVSTKFENHVSGNAMGQLHSQLTEILHINTMDLFHGIWTTGHKLREAAKKSQGTDGKPQAVDLHSFSVVWKYQPALEVYVNSLHVYTLECLAQVTFTISAYTAGVEQGYINRLRVGPTTAAAKLEIAKVPVRSPRPVQVFAGGPITLPGRGIPLVRHKETDHSHPYGH